MMEEMWDSLEQSIHAVFYIKAMEGWRNLKPNEIRISQTPDCSFEIFFSKVIRDHDPPEMVMMRRDPINGVVNPYQGKALAGTFIHEHIQRLLIESGFNEHVEGLECEKEVESDLDGIKRTGHIDIYYEDDYGPQMADIKTVSSTTFKDIVNRTWKDRSYSHMKREKSIAQANEYASIVGALEFDIIWVDRESLNYKIDTFDYKPQMHRDIDAKLLDIFDSIRKHSAGDKNVRPKFCGVAMCNYCENLNVECPGKALLEKMGA